MINEFLDILKDGYTVNFSENKTLNMIEILVEKNAVFAKQSVNLDHLVQYGLKKETTILVIIHQLIREIEESKKGEAL